MANALARETTVRYVDGAGLQLMLDVVFFGNDVPESPLSESVEVTMPDNPTAAEVRAAMSSAISSFAQVRGFSCPGSNQTIPVWQKG